MRLFDKCKKIIKLNKRMNVEGFWKVWNKWMSEKTKIEKKNIKLDERINVQNQIKKGNNVCGENWGVYEREMNEYGGLKKK